MIAFDAWLLNRFQKIVDWSNKSPFLLAEYSMYGSIVAQFLYILMNYAYFVAFPVNVLLSIGVVVSAMILIGLMQVTDFRGGSRFLRLLWVALLFLGFLSYGSGLMIINVANALFWVSYNYFIVCRDNR